MMSIPEQREKSEILLSLAEQVSDFGYFSWNVPEDILEWSDGLMKVYGIERQDFSGRGDEYFHRLHPEDQELVQQALQTAIQNGGRFENTERIFRHDGEMRWLETSGRLTIDAAGKPLLLMGICRDITDSVRQSNELRRQIDELKFLESRLSREQKSQALGTLAGGIAHDFNNLLTVIIAGCELIDQLPADALPDETRNIVHAIAEAGELGGKLTKQLALYSNSSKGQPQPVDLNQAIRDSHRVISRILTDSIQLSLSLHPAQPVVRIDPTHLQQTILNLAVNARDAMPAGGKLSIRTDIVTHPPIQAGSTNTVTGNHVVIEFSDTGVGIADDVRARIFDPFFTTKPSAKGSGLGLSVVDGIVQSAGGYAEVDSIVGDGASFRIYLPTVSEAAVNLEAEASSNPLREREVGGSRTVLIVEDEPAVLKIVQETYRRAGFRTITQSDPVEALRYLNQAPSSIDLMITDVSMPTISGPELVASIHAGREKLPFPVLFMSGNSDEVLEKSHGISDSTHFIRKPIHIAEMLRKTEELLLSNSRLT